MINSTQSLFANKRKYNHNSTTPNGRLPDLSNGAIFNDLERPLPPGFKVTPFFDAKYLRNGTIHRHSFNRILIRSYTRPIQQCRFEWPWVTLSDLAKYSMTGSVVRSLCDSWASCFKEQEVKVIWQKAPHGGGAFPGYGSPQGVESCTIEFLG